MTRTMWFARFPWDLAIGLQADRVYRSEDGAEGCAYFMQDRRPQVLPPGLAVLRLHLLQEVAGASAGEPAHWHYIVATDVLAEQEDELNAWYQQEHLPGLAAVPGTAKAARYRVTEGGGPCYHACYDLADRKAFNSPAWLAVRATAWSSRVRPAFRNTLRTMYRSMP